MARDNNIYGLDETSYASKIASDALTPSTGDVADYWGPSEQGTQAQAKGNVGDESTDDATILRGRANASVSNRGRGDVESLLNPYPQNQRMPRHTKGPSTSSDEGGGKTTPPPRSHMGVNAKKSGPAFAKKVS